MRFRIMKNNNGTVYTILVSGELNDDDVWDILRIAQTMLCMRQCRELIIDLSGASIEDAESVLNTDTLASVFEERLLMKDCTLVFRLNEGSEICLCSDQLPLEPQVCYANVRIDEAKFYSKAMHWLGQEARLLAN